MSSILGNGRQAFLASLGAQSLELGVVDVGVALEAPDRGIHETQSYWVALVAAVFQHVSIGVATAQNFLKRTSIESFFPRFMTGRRIVFLSKIFNLGGKLTKT